jgi:Holliday junction resolvase RusA-like endonuclease
MSEISFFMPMIPPTITQQEHQVKVVKGKPVFYDPPRLSEAKSKLIGALWKHAPEETIPGPVQLITKWIWPLENLPMIEKIDPNYFEWKTTKPDTDNLIKMLKDCMTKVGFWVDDCQVVSEITEKMYSFTPGIYVKVVEL